MHETITITYKYMWDYIQEQHAEGEDMGSGVVGL